MFGLDPLPLLLAEKIGSWDLTLFLQKIKKNSQTDTREIGAKLSTIAVIASRRFEYPFFNATIPQPTPKKVRTISRPSSNCQRRPSTQKPPERIKRITRDILISAVIKEILSKCPTFGVGHKTNSVLSAVDETCWTEPPRG